MGAEFNYIGFNGIVTDIVVRFDANAFVKDASAFT